MTTTDLRTLLDAKADYYNRPAFIEHDPISIPHRFSRLQDVEIMGFWAAVLAWGQRPVILKKAAELITLMDGTPYDFVKNHQDSDLKRFLAFKHRTFNATDALYFLHFFRQYYQQHDSLETAFVTDVDAGETIQANLVAFHDRFCCDPYFPARTRKHIATPTRNSSCKRLCMFLRWMVRRDDRGVDFGLWTRIRPAQLIIPVDVHVNRVAQSLGLLVHRRGPTTPPDWKAALALTARLRELDPNDPVRYDFALFGLGVAGEL